MENVFIKTASVINSCTTISQVDMAFSYVMNALRRKFIDSPECDELYCMCAEKMKKITKVVTL